MNIISPIDVFNFSLQNQKFKILNVILEENHYHSLTKKDFIKTLTKVIKKNKILFIEKGICKGCNLNSKTIVVRYILLNSMYIELAFIVNKNKIKDIMNCNKISIESEYLLKDKIVLYTKVDDILVPF